MPETNKVITIRIRGKAVDQLTELKKKTNAKFYSDVVRNALRVYNTLEQYRDELGDIIIETSDNKRMKLRIP